jgi:tetratricopeptide (TPR) repeat protein
VEVLRIWFEAEERFETVCRVPARAAGSSPGAMREAATTIEYFAASLRGTGLEERAHELALRQWLRVGDLREAALAHAEFDRTDAGDPCVHEVRAYSALGRWALGHDDPQTARAALAEAATSDRSPETLLDYGLALGAAGLPAEALQQFNAALTNASGNAALQAWALVNRGVAKGMVGDLPGELADYTAVVEMEGAPKHLVAQALFNRGVAKGDSGDRSGAMADFTTLVEMPGIPGVELGKALANRGIAARHLGNSEGAMEDWQRVLRIEAADAGSWIVAAAGLVELHWLAGQEGGAAYAIELFRERLAGRPDQERAEIIVKLLSRLARAGLKEGWVRAWRLLTSGQPPTVAEPLTLLEPVARVLEGADVSELNALPPERREFVQSVLSRFKTESSSRRELPSLSWSPALKPPKPSSAPTQPGEGERLRSRDGDHG